MKEKLLFAKLKSKDKQAFTEAYDLYIDKIYRFVYFKISDPVEAEDITSAVFLKTWNYVQQNSITDEKTLPALLYKIARNSVIDHYRKISNENQIPLEGEGEVINIVDEKHDLKKRFELESDMEILREKLTLLKDEYREIIVLKYVDELTIAEIAQIVGKSRGNVRILSFRALAALRELMSDGEVESKK